MRKGADRGTTLAATRSLLEDWAARELALVTVAEFRQSS